MKEPLFAEFPFDEYGLRVSRARTLMEHERIDKKGDLKPYVHKEKLKLGLVPLCFL